IPWWGVLITVAIAMPWYVLIEARNPGALRHIVVDNHPVCAHTAAPGSRRGRGARPGRISQPDGSRLPALGARIALGGRAGVQASLAGRAGAPLAPARGLV